MRTLLLPLLLATGLAQAQTPPATPAPETPAPVERARVDQASLEKQADTLLARALQEDEVQWLTAGEDRFLGLWHEDETGQPQGSVLILHDSGTSPDWPTLVDALRLGLPPHGWHTLAIALPAPLPPPVPPRAPATEPAADAPKSADGKPADPAPPADASATPPPPVGPTPADVEKQAIARIQAARTQLQANKALPVVAIIGIGTGAARALDALVAEGSNTLPPTSTLISINPAAGAARLGALRDSGIAVLDVSYAERDEDSQTWRHTRQVDAQRARLRYAQMRLPDPGEHPASPEATAVKRLRSWLARTLESLGTGPSGNSSAAAP